MFNIGDRIIDCGYEGTITGIISSLRSMVMYDDRISPTAVSNFYLTKIKTKKIKAVKKLTYWK